MLYTLLCLISDDDNIFPIEIDETELVGSLKLKIKKQNPQTLATIDARSLALYHINVKFDGTGPRKHLEEAQKIGQELGNRAPLEPWRKISRIGGGFPEDMLHILVVIPPGEPIHSRACRWRVVTDATPCKRYRWTGDCSTPRAPSRRYT